MPKGPRWLLPFLSLSLLHRSTFSHAASHSWREREIIQICLYNDELPPPSISLPILWQRLERRKHFAVPCLAALRLLHSSAPGRLTHHHASAIMTTSLTAKQSFPSRTTAIGQLSHGTVWTKQSPVQHYSRSEAKTTSSSAEHIKLQPQPKRSLAAGMLN
ncbi:hypothetical protein MHYP_G00237320 [Metynnis hypsauchen]